jgi:hypothetical protein
VVRWWVVLAYISAVWIAMFLGYWATEARQAFKEAVQTYKAANRFQMVSLDHTSAYLLDKDKRVVYWLYDLNAEQVKVLAPAEKVDAEILRLKESLKSSRSEITRLKVSPVL